MDFDKRREILIEEKPGPLASDTPLNKADNSTGRRLIVPPDFIIIGTMKSGTTTLHSLLAGHPGVFMPEGEVQLFTVDDIEQNPVFFTYLDQEWAYQHFERYFYDYVSWHARMYEGVQESHVKGEDAPSYLPSRQAMQRVAQYAPHAKLIVLLRDPVARLYSHYWHWVRTYRAIFSLEDTLRFQHGNLLQRSYYEEQLRYCFEQVPRQQVHIVLFEEFIKDQARVTEQIYRFLGLEVPAAAIDKNRHANRGRYPRYPALALWRNRVLRDLYGRRYRGEVPRVPESGSMPALSRLVKRVHGVVNPNGRQRAHPMKDKTRIFLAKLLYDRNAGLADLLDRDLAQWWPSFREAQSTGSIH